MLLPMQPGEQREVRDEERVRGGLDGGQGNTSHEGDAFHRGHACGGLFLSWGVPPHPFPPDGHMGALVNRL